MGGDNALGLGLPKAAGTLVRAPFVQGYLKNQLAAGPGLRPGGKIPALAAALAANAGEQGR
jgi:hypothetical protein